MKVLDELNHLESFLREYCEKSNKPVKELYEQVQTCGNVLPRVYLLCTVGSIYIHSKQAPALEILKDMIEMCKGVQHPMRGLFLRNYLALMTKDKLPEEGTDAIDFLLKNFGETNRLWIRMQHQKGTRDRKRREQERQELRVLVGTSLVRLSQMESVDLDVYGNYVLPKVLKLTVNCKDRIAQNYIMDCVIQIFPDEFHIHCLEPFLIACSELHQHVDLTTILVSLMERLAKYEATSADEHIFSLFEQYIQKIALSKLPNINKVEEDMRSKVVENMLQLYVGWMNFVLKVYQDQPDYMGKCIDASVEYLDSNPNVVTPGIIQQIEKLMEIPINAHGIGVLKVESFQRLLTTLPFRSRRQVAMRMVEILTDRNVQLNQTTLIEQSLTFLSPLIKDDLSMQTGVDEIRKEEFQQEQYLVAKLVHLIHHEDPDCIFPLYCAARKHFGQGGIKRIQYTLVPLVFGALRLAQTLYRVESSGKKGKTSIRKILQFVHEIVTALASNFHQLAFRLFLQCAQTADACHFEAISYEFISQAFILYEDEMGADSKAQCEALYIMIGTLLTCQQLTQDNYDTLITKTTQYAAKLLKKADQCSLVATSAHLFWPSDSTKQDGARVLECLQRSLKIADVCGSNLALFVDLLDHYLFFYQNKTPQITAQYLSGLKALIKEHLEQTDDAGSVAVHYESTLKHLETLATIE